MADEKVQAAQGKSKKYLEVGGKLVTGGFRSGTTKTGSAFALYGLQVSCGLSRVANVSLQTPVAIPELDQAIEDEVAVVIQLSDVRPQGYEISMAAKSITLPSGTVITATE